jgi:hypothetical protein
LPVLAPSSEPSASTTPTIPHSNPTDP